MLLDIIIIIMYIFIHNIYITLVTTFNIFCGPIKFHYLNMARKNFWWDYEYYMITPYPSTLLLMVQGYQSLLPIKKDKLKNYVTFTRLDLPRGDRIACDWCSIVNGISEMYYRSINQCNIDDLNKITDLSKLYEVKLYLQSCLQKRKNPYAWEHERDFLISETKYITHPVVKVIIDIKCILTQLELRWCPFKASVDYYRNNDKRYLNYDINKTERMFIEMGEYLSKHDTIECWRCSLELNEHLSSKYVTTHKIKSPFTFILNQLDNM